MYWYNLTELLPPVYANIKSMFAAADSENTELLKIVALFNRIKDNLFIQTCDIPTLEYWENLLGIELYGEETIEERRQMVLICLANNQPITEPYVKEVLNSLFGVGHWEFRHDASNNLRVRISIFDASYNQVKRFILWFNKICPAHVDWKTSHTENTQATNYISGGTTAHYKQTTSCEMTTGSGTLYLGSQSYTVNWIEVS